MIPKTILAFWRHQEARGQPASAVWCLTHAAGSGQPEGYLQGWSVSKRRMRVEAERCGGRFRLCRLVPTVNG